MALRGIKPKSIEKRFKAFFYGEAGAGKTTAAINFPSVYMIDTERGCENSQYVEILEKNGGAIFQTSDFDEMVKECKELLSCKHQFKTLVIDPLTVVYNDLIDRAAAKVGTEFGRHYGEANKEMKRLLNLLLRLDMNVIITSHSKKEYGDNLIVLGNTFDCYKKLDYLFDLVIEIQKRPSGRVGLIKKSRLKDFGELETFPFNYNEIATRYGKEALEKEAAVIELATNEQLNELEHFIKLLNYPQENVDKWLTKAGASDFTEMKKEDVQKCIDLLKAKMSPVLSGTIGIINYDRLRTMPEVITLDEIASSENKRRDDACRSDAHD